MHMIRHPLSPAPQAFETQWNSSVVNRSISLQRVREEFYAEKARLEVLMAAAAAAQAAEARNGTLLAQQLRTQSAILERNISVLTAAAAECAVRLNETAMSADREKKLAYMRTNEIVRNMSAALVELKRNLSKVPLQK